MEYVLLTGAYGGMGVKTIDALVRRGYSVIALDKNINVVTDNVIPIQVDVTDVESVKRAFERVKEITDRLFAIVHLAGVYMLDSLIEIPEEQFEKIFKINVFGAYHVNKTFMPLLNNGSKIVMITSELAPLDPLPFTGLYAITKSALDKYAYSLKMELQLLDVFVSVIRSGAVSTGMLGVSTDALNRFCDNTKVYKCNAEKFKNIVNKVEAKCVPPEKVAKKVLKVLEKKKPKFVYNLNRNKLLLLLNVLPKNIRFKIIKSILKTK